MRSFPSIVALLLMTGACAESAKAPFEAPAPPEPVYQLVRVSPDYEEGVPGQALADPFMVQVQDSAGHGVEGVKVTWTIVSGRATLATETPTASAADGRAMMSLTPLTWRVDMRAVIQSRDREDSVHFRSVPHPAAVYDCISPVKACGPGTLSFVFYPDSTFGLRVPTAEVPGLFGRRGDVVSIWTPGDNWGATATIHSDSLMVEYNDWAQLSDWENSTFLLKSGSPLAVPRSR